MEMRLTELSDFGSDLGRLGPVLGLWSDGKSISSAGGSTEL